ncbi:MAG: hypothetical protein IT462_07675 [Planctomycetes bacterium]|nr:hypothetical protein [Planctomycetota bacterium]
MSVVTACLTCRKITGKPGAFVLRKPFSQLRPNDSTFWVFVEIRLRTGERAFSIRVRVEDDEHEVVWDWGDELYLLSGEHNQFAYMVELSKDLHYGQYAVHVEVNGRLESTRVLYFVD